ncbi:MAG: helix-turn-helix transcriptional regulator [Schaedlerella sp.]|nr:helix-turn-helix transcriptional regulator [Schaedlerella sp.]
MATTDDTIKKTISQNITKYREEAGLSQKELAKRLSITPSRVSNWEQGANCPTIDMLFEVCKLLNISINDIYGIYPDANVMLAYHEKQLIEKYRDLDTHGKEMVDIVLLKEHERWKTEQKISNLIPLAAHNDEANTPEEQVLLKQDIDEL